MTELDPESKAWNAWLHKNAEKDKAYFRKLARTAGIAVLIGLACLLIWAWAQRDGKAYDLEGTERAQQLYARSMTAPTGAQERESLEVRRQFPAENS